MSKVYRAAFEMPISHLYGNFQTTLPSVQCASYNQKESEIIKHLVPFQPCFLH